MFLPKRLAKRWDFAFALGQAGRYFFAHEIQGGSHSTDGVASAVCRVASALD